MVIRKYFKALARIDFRRSQFENDRSAQICKYQALEVLLGKNFRQISYHFSIPNWEEQAIPMGMNQYYSVSHTGEVQVFSGL